MVRKSQGKTIASYQKIDLHSRIEPSFFRNDALKVAPALLGQYLVRKFTDGTMKVVMITETEAYRGEEDLACHASKGRTPRTEVMYLPGGHIYIYLIYGMYWMLNIVSGKTNQPQAVLIRAVEGFTGPGKLTKALELDKTFNNEVLSESDRIWICRNEIQPEYSTTPRIGIEYAGEIWKNKPWRFVLKTT